jgi:hypothetical protein
MKPLAKQNLQQFINTKYTTLNKNKCYVDGIKTDLEDNYLWEISDKITEYLYSKGEFN